MSRDYVPVPFKDYRLEFALLSNESDINDVGLSIPCSPYGHELYDIYSGSYV